MSDISLLHIFSKNTDANASIKGYNYQTLKTLETWISNSINSIENDIYCDYEEDIFQQNLTLNAVQFRQLKLYSSSFSFSSEEIKKCIIHFFMLHIKTDYLSAEKEFIFETNSQIAKKYENNDADLLRNWYENQDILSDKLLEECSSKVKEIISSYIEKQAITIKDKIDTKLLEEALTIFNSLHQDDWKGFVKRIKWKFANIDSDIEFSSTIKSIEALILQLSSPVQINENNYTAIFGILYKEVSLRSSEENPENRKLTREILELLLLNIGTEKDKWYAKVYDEWKNVKEIKVFHIGEFFEILDASRYCRWNNSLNLHDNLWLNFLSFFIFKLSIHEKFRLQAIYEYLWLKNRPDYNNHKEPLGDLFGSEDLVRDYLKDFDVFENARELEDAHNILTISFTAKIAEKANLGHKEMINWFRCLYRTINQRIKTTPNLNEKCSYQEALGTFLLFTSQLKPKETAIILSPFEEILTIINDAPFYDVSMGYNIKCPFLSDEKNVGSCYI